MTMLKNRALIKALIHFLPKTFGRQNDKYNQSMDSLIDEMTKLYRQLGIYDNIIDKIKLEGII